MEYTVQAAGRATGISPWRIRTWERRYGVPAPVRDIGGRRTYSEADLAVLRRMAALVDQGMRASHAADAVRTEGDLALQVTTTRPEDARVHQLLTAASSFDEAGCIDAMRSAAELGWGDALESVVMPALRNVGRLWERGELSPAVEHFLSRIVQRELFVALAGLPKAAAGVPRILIACAEDEFHDTGALALSLLLRERGADVVCLGADVPASAVVDATRIVRPDAVCLTGVIATSMPMLAEAARALIESRTSAQVFVGGPALAAGSSELPPAPRLPDSLRAAVEVLLAAPRTDRPA